MLEPEQSNSKKYSGLNTRWIAWNQKQKDVMLETMSIRQEIQRARKAAKLTQSELADQCTKLGGNIRQKDISEFESGKQNPSLEKIDIIAKALRKTWKLE